MLRQYILFIVLFIVWYNEVIANNSSYITLSNQIARSRTLSILANNAANSSTIGYMEDELILHKVDRRQNKKKNNSFVKAYNTFLPKVDGSLKVTNRNLDLAIIGNGYFKVLTSLGVRYTLNGMIFLDNQGNLINQDGLPFLSNDNQLINIPLDTSDIYVNKDGVIYANKEEVAQIGVFDFIGESNLNKEGSGLYATTSDSILSTEYSIISGSLRNSNVNNIKAMNDLIELQRSNEITNNLMSSLNDLEKNGINKILK